MATEAIQTQASAFTPRDLWLSSLTSRQRSIWLLALATFANGLGVATVLIAAIIFNKVFANALDEIPDLPFELFAEAGGGVTPLVRPVVRCL